jgi:hypothetical protein
MRFNRAVESGHRPRRHERADRGAPTAEEQKFFSKYGTDAELIFIRQAPMRLAGMSALEASIDIQMGRFDDWPTTPSS